MRKPRVRVEAKKLSFNAGRDERMKNIAGLQRIFKRICGDYGILHSYKEHEFFIRKTDKKRRARAQAKLIARLGSETSSKDRLDGHYFNREEW